MHEKLAHAALLVIDVQQEMFEKSNPVYKAEELIQNITSLVQAAHEAGAPVIYIQHAGEGNLVFGTPGWQFHPALQTMQPDFTVHKRHGNAFEDTELEAILHSQQVHTLVVTGMVTHGCVRATTLGGLKAGYRVLLVKDAHSSFSPKAAQLIEEWNGKLGEQGAELKNSAEIALAKQETPVAKNQ